MDNLRGAALMVLSMAFFATEDVFVKIVTQRVPLGEVLVLLGGLGAIVFGLLAQMRGHSALSPLFFHPVILIRNLGELVGTTCFVVGLMILPLGLLSALLQANPLFVNLGAILFLGMSVGWRRWLAIGIGLVGVIVILRPGMDSFRVEALLGLGAAIGLAVRDVATRRLPAGVHPLQTSSWGFAMGLISGTVLLVVGEPAVLPSATDSAIIVTATVLGMVGYYTLTRAMQIGDVPAVTPFRYTRLVFAILFAFFVFSEVPDGYTILGAGLIVSAGLYTILREARLHRAERRALSASPVRPG